MLKSTLFNIILSQQIGYGFYDKASITIFTHFHCYINIPETCGRDSLFQAEARRCIDILNLIEISKNKSNHFCVFDELYSGTNPYEASASAYGYLKHLSKLSNVKFVLTTHYLSLCKKIKTDKEEKKNTSIENKHMQVLLDENEDFKYTYKLQEGISDIKGGLKVLKDLNYPQSILNDAKLFIKNS